MRKVKKIAEENGFALVELVEHGDYRRLSLPVEKLHCNGDDCEVSDPALAKGIPYGVDWDAQFPGLDNLNWQMHRRGIWTFQDAYEKSKDARTAVIGATGKILQTILEGG